MAGAPERTLRAHIRIYSGNRGLIMLNISPRGVIWGGLGDVAPKEKEKKKKERNERKKEKKRKKEENRK